MYNENIARNEKDGKLSFNHSVHYPYMV